MRLCLFAAVSLLTISVSAAAAEEQRVPAEIRACAAIRSKSERLACFDQAVAFLSADQKEGQTQAAPSAEAMFGMKASTPAAEEAEQKTERAQIEAITAKIKKLSYGGDGAIFELDNGQTWLQISSSGSLLVKSGDEVKITRGALSSFNLKTPSGRVIKVKRVQ